MNTDQNVTQSPPKRMKRRRMSIVNSSQKVGRNDPCPCGSRKKYKKCCLIRTAMKEQAMAVAKEQISVSGHVHTEECNHDPVSEPDKTTP